MAALAYLLPPLSGLLAYLNARSARVRFHGLQSVTLGVIWPAALWSCSWISPTAVQVAFAAGALVWLFLLVVTAAGRDPRLPAGRWLRRAAEVPPRG